MYHGLEVRPPLLDVRVAEFAASLPPRARMRRNPNGTMTGKVILKRALSRKFPDEFVHRRKMGFGMPRDRWLLPGQPGRRLLEEVALGRGSPLHQWFDPRTIERLLAVHQVGENDKSNVLWLLLVLGLWSDRNPTAAIMKECA
jgi:asparagine synthase (glutamine-hydrolysing)